MEHSLKLVSKAWWKENSTMMCTKAPCVLGFPPFCDELWTFEAPFEYVDLKSTVDVWMRNQFKDFKSGVVALKTEQLSKNDCWNSAVICQGPPPDPQLSPLN